MINIDVNFIRAQFPAFSSEELKDKAFFDNAGGSYCNKFDRYMKTCQWVPRIVFS